MSHTGKFASLWLPTLGAIVHRDGWTCAYCSAPLRISSEIHLDHVIPVAHGGRNKPGNLVVTCAACNLSRGSGPLPERARAEVERRLALPLDRAEGKRVAELLYPESCARRIENKRVVNARYRERRKRLAEGLEGTAFPFGAKGQEGCAA